MKTHLLGADQFIKFISSTTTSKQISIQNQYLLKTSCHPNHTKKANPFSLSLRIRRICSTDTFFDQRSRELIEYLIKRGYSRTSLQRDANRVRSIPPTSFPGSLFSASLGRWKKDPGCGWSCDHPESGWQKSLLDRRGGRVFCLLM